MDKETEETKSLKESEFETDHIGVLDGIRAMAVLVIVWYHVWQQSWLMPSIGSVSFDWIPRYGFLLVDMFILLSGFCLFLPYAKKMVYGGQTQSAKDFYIKRIARILPSYYIAIFTVLFIFILPSSQYSSIGEALRDVFAHLFFVHNLFPETLLLTHFSVGLWTVAVEAQIYLFFPLIAKAFTKKPIITYIALLVVGAISLITISLNLDGYNNQFWVNNTLTFIIVFANGMFGAFAYVHLTKNKKRNIYVGIIFTIIAICCIIAYSLLTTTMVSYSSLQKWQIDYRFVLSLIFLLFIISTIMSVKVFRKIFENPIARFISKISYNLYIWHLVVVVKLKEFKIPFWEGETPPNMTDNIEWKWQYTILAFLISIIIATFMTYCVEKPLYKLITNIRLKKKETKGE